MEGIKKGTCTECESCNTCSKCSYKGGCCFLRWILGIIVILLVFWLGLTVGKFSGFIHYGGYGNGCGVRPMMEKLWHGPECTSCQFQDLPVSSEAQ